jgi:23S rRNA pseudouridine1911/1915/1917 synthase
MALKKYSFQSLSTDSGKRLDQFLAERLPEAVGQPVSKAKVRKLVVAGAAYLNGRRVRIASKELLPGARVEIFVDAQRLLSDPASQERQDRQKSGDSIFRLTAADVLYEDAYLILVNKPSGLPTQPTLDEARENLYAAVRRFFVERDGIVEPYVGLHHRLDRDTSGVVLFTKAREANAGVAQLFSQHLAVKTYWAITARPQPDVSDSALQREWEIKNYLGKGGESGKRARFTAVRSGGDFAHTDFRLLEAFPEALWIEAKPRTGRTHQIRVHLSEHGLPILGDPVYGKPAASSTLSPRSVTALAPRTLLHAASLTFPHPISKVEISIQSPLPKDFSACLGRFKSRLLDQLKFGVPGSSGAF